MMEKILVKIGSALISRGSNLNYGWMRSKIREIADLSRSDNRFIIVSSGAVAAGMELTGLRERPDTVLDLQLLSGLGQIKLMKYYKDFFMEENIMVAQVLLTHHNFASQLERGTIGSIVRSYLGRNIIPIVNENDMVNKEEFDYKRTFSDNDILAALVAVNIGVDRTVLLTDVDGLFTGDPKKDRNGRLLREVDAITPEIKKMASRETNELGLGGMSSKVDAAEMITAAGIDTIIANGHYRLADILELKSPSTVFRAKRGN
jgi:glutamate 5-kinase